MQWKIDGRSLVAAALLVGGALLMPPADTANVKAPHLRFTKEEAIRQANLVDLVAYAIVALLFQRVNIPGLATQRENETSAHIPELVCIDPATNIFDAAAQTRKVLR